MPGISPTAKERLVFALDVPSRREAERYVRLLDGAVGCFKVGLELFISEGPDVLKTVSGNSSAAIFLDLKLHDIPATVHGALRSAAAHKVKYITVHAQEGEDLLLRAAEEASGVEVLAVTVLTSLGEPALSRLGYRPGLTVRELVLDRAALAKKSGCRGVVCSGQEAAAVKARCGQDFKVVVPGIRPSWSVVAGDDQARSVTPRAAVVAGADLIVVGRPIRAAKDPRAAALRILEEIEEVKN